MRLGLLRSALALVLESDEQPLLGAFGAEMDQAGSFVFRQVVKTGLQDVLGVVANGE